MANHPAVLLIGRRDDVEEILFVKEQGYRVILLNTQIPLEDAIIADFPIEMDLNQEDDVVTKALEISKRIPITAVYTNNEYRIVLGAKIAEALGLKYHLSSEAAQNCRSKAQTRACLTRHQVSPIQYAIIQSPAEILHVLSEMKLPVIVKPSNDAGSHMVQKCNTLEEAWTAAELIRTKVQNWVGQPLEKHILVEEYIEGPEFSVESCTIHGATHIIAITAKNTSALIEEKHLVPAPLSEQDSALIHELVVQALTVLGADYTVAHTEVKLSPQGPKIIEVNARVGGDQIHRLVHAVTGYDLRKLAFHIVTGGTFASAPRDTPVTDSAQIQFLLADQEGYVRWDKQAAQSIKGIEQVESSVRDGDYVVMTESNYNRLGYLIAHGVDGKHASLIMDAAKEAMHFFITKDQDGKVPSSTDRRMGVI
ncbi:ATP-grasp domain-containing protein [Paenibacillus amylolyticus]|uniref:ATP-grasp domain-containing protein n=1 Tax=Paenibacillus amylolyticus TaxID=1451 RepID=UPI003D98D0A5